MKTKPFFILLCLSFIISCEPVVETHTVTYSVEGTATAFSISYNNESGALQHLNQDNTTLPFSITINDSEEKSFILLVNSYDSNALLTATVSCDDWDSDSQTLAGIGTMSPSIIY